jgi:chromosome segregation ATPase
MTDIPAELRTKEDIEFINVAAANNEIARLQQKAHGLLDRIAALEADVEMLRRARQSAETELARLREAAREGH